MEVMALGTDRWAEESEDRAPPTRMPQGTPVGTWAPGPQLLAVRAPSYFMSTCDLADLPEAGLVPEEGLAQNLCEWETLTPVVTISVLQAEAGHLLSLPAHLLREFHCMWAGRGGVSGVLIALSAH